MSRKDVVLEKIKNKGEELKQFHIASLFLFGSVVRGDDGPESDIDILVEFTEPVGMFTFVRLNRYLDELLGTEVDLVTPEALKERLRDRILSEAIRAA